MYNAAKATRTVQIFEYTNRKGVTYYLHAHPRRGGTTQYTLKRSADGALAELPAGYEVVENVNGQVSVRRFRSRHITAEEEAEVRSSLAQRGLDAYRSEVKDAQITIFEPDRDPDEFAAEFDPFDMMPAGIGEQVKAMARERFGDATLEEYLTERRERLRQRLQETTRYSPVMRFRLADRERRLFEVARMTARGEGGWHVLDILPLAAAVKRYVKHVGRDSFFELI